MKISIFGLGYVGAVSSACFAKLGHDVIGVDIVPYKVDSINGGEAPIEEKGLNELIYKAIKKQKLRAVINEKEAILNTDISFVCVGTPPKKDGNLDLSILKKTCENIGKVLKEKGHHIIVIRSTMFPGSLDLLKKIIEKASGKECGKGFDLAVNPEFLREGTAIEDFFNPPYVVVGAEKKAVGRAVLSAYKNVTAKRFLVKPGVAQMIKYASNSFHALKVSFANEIGAVCKKLNIDSGRLMDLFCEDKDLNISSYYLKPGFAYGGSCLPKDLAALKKQSQKLKVPTPLIDSISQSNLEQMKRAVKLIESKKKKNIGILGITFKADTDDIRGNPVLYVINKLLNKKYNIQIFDKLIDKSNLKTISKSYRKEVYDLVNRENLKDKVSDISKLFSNADSVLKQDIIIISNRDTSLKPYLKKLSKNQILIDLQNIFSSKDTSAEYNTF